MYQTLSTKVVYPTLTILLILIGNIEHVFRNENKKIQNTKSSDLKDFLGALSNSVEFLAEYLNQRSYDKLVLVRVADSLEHEQQEERGRARYRPPQHRPAPAPLSFALHSVVFSRLVCTSSKQRRLYKFGSAET